MKLYNTLTKKEDELGPINGNKFTMYACGPTVYNYAHIGNLRTFVIEDILRRALKYLGFEVEEVMNITDIEDKIIKAANEQRVDYREITKKYEGAFLADLEKLNVEKPERLPRATEEIDGMIKIIEKLLETGYAYKSEDGSIYFSIAKFKDYGKLAHLDFSGLKEGARVDQDEYEKENAQDFVLWKAKKEGEPSWPAPFGEGRPGWHIECSAMSMKYLGETVDIHAGAVDLIFPHHENEIAQSEAYTGKPFVRHWFHPEHLMVNGKKMSKSLGNIYTIEEVCEKYSVEPLAFRMLCLQSSWQDKLNFTDDSITAAQTTLKGLRDFVTRLSKINGENNLEVDKLIAATRDDFSAAISDNLNTPKAASILFTFIREMNKFITQGISKQDGEKAIGLLDEFDDVLGLDITKTDQISADVLELLDQYESARQNKDYDTSDKLRDKIQKHGFAVENTEDGNRLRKL